MNFRIYFEFSVFVLTLDNHKLSVRQKQNNVIMCCMEPETDLGLLQHPRWSAL